MTFANGDDDLADILHVPLDQIIAMEEEEDVSRSCNLNLFHTKPLT